MNTNTLTKEKIASILEPHAQQLAAMKARGKTLSEMLYWLRNTHGWVLNPAQLERFLKQQESATQPQAETAAKAKPAADAELEYQQLMYVHPSAATPCHAKAIATADLSSEALAKEDLPSVALAKEGQLSTLNNKLTLETMMAKFKQVLSRVMDKSDDKPETLKVIDKMMHTVIGYEHGKERLEHSKRTLKIKEDNQQRRASKPITNGNPAGDDVSLINPSLAQDRIGRTALDNPTLCPVEILSPGLKERTLPSQNTQQSTAADASDPNEGKPFLSPSTVNPQLSTHP